MTHGPRFPEIAKAAGVSVSTVDRVLNERGSVSVAAREKVMRAALHLGVRRVLPDDWHRTITIEVILPRNETPFWGRLSQAIRLAAQRLPRHIVVHRTFVEETEDAMERAICEPRKARSALAIAPVRTARLAQALEGVIAQGMPVATLVSGLPCTPPVAHFGADNLAAGRTIGLLMRRLAAPDGRVLVLQANDWLEAHHDRVSGFLEVLRQRPDLKTKVVLTRERTGVSRQMLLQALAGGPLAGVYDTGDTTAELEGEIRKLAPAPLWITHERTPKNETLLREGLIDFLVDQDPDAQAALTLTYLADACGTEGLTSATQARPELRLLCAENV